MAIQKEILESYREYREEIDTLLDETTLFALALVMHLGRTEVPELARHLDLDTEEMNNFCSKMEAAGFVRVSEQSGNAVKSVEVLRRGRQYLALVLGENAAQAQSLSARLRPPASKDRTASSSTELVERARQGDEEAFVLIFERYSRPVLSFIYDQVGDRDLAEDLTQETFVRAYSSLSGLSEHIRLATWLFNIAKSVVHESLRMRSLESVQRVEFDYESVSEFTQESPAGELLNKASRGHSATTHAPARERAGRLYSQIFPPTQLRGDSRDHRILDS
jgi:RNA polymerase sigma factor (sigma-70 family)